MKTKVIRGIEIFSFLVLGLFLLKEYSLAIPNVQSDQSSYFQNLTNIIQQINGSIPTKTIYGNMHGAVYPIVLGYLADLFGFAEPETIVFYVQGITVIGAIIICGILVWYWLNDFGMAFGTAIGIWVLSKPFLLDDFNYSYWASGACVLVAIPILCDLFANIKEPWHKKNTIELSVLIITMIIDNIIRQHAGLPLLMFILLYMVLRMHFSRKSRWKALIGVLATMLLFVWTEPILHNIYDMISGKIQIENVEKPWHAIWCGLGYIENEYGFEWLDSAADNYVKQVNPQVRYCSEEYFEILKTRVVEVACKDPGYIAQVLIMKFIDSLKLGFHRWGKLLCMTLCVWIITYLITPPRDRRLKNMILAGGIGGGMVCVGVVQGVVGWPAERYIYASYAGFVWLLIIFLADSFRNCLMRIKAMVCSNKEKIGMIATQPIVRNTENKVLYIIVPCYNEEESLDNGYTFSRLEALVRDLVKEGLCSPRSKILMIDDGSSDRTRDILEKKHQENPLFSYVSLSRNFGHQYALLSGLMSVKDIADITITIDADLQQDIEAMREFILKYQEGYEIVYGVRDSRDTDGLFKKWSANMFYVFMRKIGGCNIIKNHADYRLISKKALNSLAEFKETNLFLRGLVPLVGYKSCIVYFKVSEREYGKSKYTLKKMLQLAVDGVTSLSIRPIKIIFLGGMIIFALSCCIAIGYFLAYLKGMTISGWTSIIMSLWMLGGLIMMSIGCVGEYIGKLYLEAKKRPRYIIDAFVNDCDYEYGGKEDE